MLGPGWHCLPWLLALSAPHLQPLLTGANVQRACLEVFQSQQHVSLEAAEHWIDTHVPEALPADTKYQDIALTVSKIACIASSGKAGGHEWPG